MNLTMFYMMLRGAIRSKSELKEVNHAFMEFDRVNNTFKMKVHGILNKELVVRDFEELKNDPMTMKLADGVVDFFKIKEDVPALTMDVDFLTKTTLVEIVIKNKDNTTKKLNFNV